MRLPCSSREARKRHTYATFGPSQVPSERRPDASKKALQSSPRAPKKSPARKCPQDKLPRPSRLPKRQRDGPKTPQDDPVTVKLGRLRPTTTLGNTDPINASIDQSTNQLIDQSTNPSINQSTNPPINQSTQQSMIPGPAECA